MVILVSLRTLDCQFEGASTILLWTSPFQHLNHIQLRYFQNYHINMGLHTKKDQDTSGIVPTVGKIKCSQFYNTWKGHPLADLAALQATATRQRPNKPVIYLVGDSSLDNKYWVSSLIPDSTQEDRYRVPTSTSQSTSQFVTIPELYASVLDKPRPKPDVAFWLNHYIGKHATAINAALEESMLRERDSGLLEHDLFVRDRIRSNDILIVSVGANDIALRPTTSTMFHMAQLAWLTPHSLIESGHAPSLRYFKKLFGDQIKAYVERIVEKQKPKAIVICMIYYPLEAAAGQQSWADMQLKALGYNRWPGQLQAAIRQMYKQATQEIKIEGTTVVPCALYEVMDGTNPDEYTARVEPNAEGGRKMARKFEGLLRPYLE